MISFGVQGRLLLTFGFLALLVFGAGGFLVYERARRAMEGELGDKLLTTGRVIAGGIIPDQRRLLAASGTTQTRTSYSVSAKLTAARERAGLHRLYVFDAEGRSLADAEGPRVGEVYPELEFEREAVAAVFGGESAVSHLYTGRAGRIYKAAYIPLEAAGSVQAVLAVVGSATFLDAMRELRNGVLVAAAIGLGGSIVLSLLVARTITGPIRRLVASADQIGAGDLETPVPDVGRDEVGYLGRTLERMRSAVMARDRSLRAMLGGVAHEIRNPLGGIELFAGLLRRDVSGSEKACERADRILHEVRHLDEIIKDFLAYARPSEPDRRRFVVSDVMEEVREVIATVLESSGVRLDVDGDVELEADPAQVRRVLLNLVLNAVQAQNAGGHVVVRAGNENGDAVVSVSDEGPGIPEGERERVFEPFYTTRQQGSGLGLTIARDLVERNGGTLSIGDERGGCVIEMRWPAGKETRA